MKNIALMLIPITCLISACSSDKDGAEEFVRGTLSDPRSAQFDDFFYSSKTHKACILVNAKNQTGGYTGITTYFLSNAAGPWKYEGKAPKGEMDCSQKYVDDPKPHNQVMNDYADHILQDARDAAKAQ